MKNKPNYIETKLALFDLFWGIAPEGSAKHKKGEDVKIFLRAALEEQAAGFLAIIGEDESDKDKLGLSHDSSWIEERNKLRQQLREQLKGMRGNSK